MANKNKEVTVPMTEKMDNDIVRELEYNDSKAEWIREAIEYRINNPEKF